MNNNVERMLDGSHIREIKEIISCCEEVQKSQESTYTKKCAKIVAYDDIKEIVEGRVRNDARKSR